MRVTMHNGKVIDTRSEIIDVIKAMPGATASEIIQLMPHVSRAATSSMLTVLKKQGLITVSEKKKEITSSGKAHSVSTFVLNPDYRPGSNVVQMQRREPTDAGLKARVDELHGKLVALQLWKEEAIARYPDLAVAPLVLKARKLVADEVRAGGDRHLADEIMAGRKDTTLMVRVTLKALEEVND